MTRYSKEEIIKAVLITDLTDKFSIKTEPVSSGNFTHRCRCPSKEHKNGTERTCSLYIDSVNNNFYCFGCGASNNVIDFYILCKDVTFSTAILDLSELVDPAKIGSVCSQKRVMNFSQLLQISNLLRSVQTQHSNDTEWIENFMKKIDIYIDEIDRYDIKKTKVLLKKIRGTINRRYSSK